MIKTLFLFISLVTSVQAKVTFKSFLAKNVYKSFDQAMDSFNSKSEIRLTKKDLEYHLDNVRFTPSLFLQGVAYYQNKPIKIRKRKSLSFSFFIKEANAEEINHDDAIEALLKFGSELKKTELFSQRGENSINLERLIEEIDKELSLCTSSQPDYISSKSKLSEQINADEVFNVLGVSGSGVNDKNLSSCQFEALSTVSPDLKKVLGNASFNDEYYSLVIGTKDALGQIKLAKILCQKFSELNQCQEKPTRINESPREGTRKLPPESSPKPQPNPKASQE